MIARPALFVILFLLIYITSFAQADTVSNAWFHIDTSIRYNRKIQDIENILLDWRQRAIRERDHITHARCVYNLVKIADRRSEDSLFFKNSLLIDQILSGDHTDPLLKLLMHVLKAKRIGEYRTKFFHRSNKNLVSSYDPDINYGSLQDFELDSLVNIHFVKAMNINNALSPLSARRMMWLSQEPATFLFEPQLTDILHAERINALYNYIPSRNDEHADKWLKLSPDEFIAIDYFNDRSAKENAIFRLYKEWMHHHAANPPTYYYIESLARKYFYKLLGASAEQEKLYEAYLTSLTHSQWSTVKAHGVYQLCLLWNSEAALYNPAKGELSYRYRLNGVPFKNEYRFHYVKALQLYTENEQMLDSFPVFKSVLQAMKVSILKPEMAVLMDDAHLPGKQIPVLITFRNVPQLHTRIIKWNVDEEFLETEKQANLKRFLQAPSIGEEMQSLQLPEDYQWHNTFIKIDPLPPGRYIILYSDSVISPQNDHVTFTDLVVSRIAVVNNNKEVFVLDRETGMPLYDARVQIDDKGPYKKISDQGSFTVRNEEVEYLKFCLDGDTLLYEIFFRENDISDEVYDKEEEDLEEYYEDNTRLLIYTDRSIYRPGQTVHYKGIFVTRHPRTGEPLVFNWKNLKLPFFKKLFYRLALKFSKEKIELNIIDPFDRDRDTINILPDKYGSFSGSYKIPADAATGEWEFDCYDFEVDYSQSSFRVEEYKRPSFEMVLEKPQVELKLGDSFSVKAIVRSFAGAQMNNVLVKYSVQASGALPDAKGKPKHRTDELLTGEAYTDENGELSIKVVDTSLLKYTLTGDREWRIEYEIEASAVDGTGESQEGSVSFYLSTEPINIEARIDPVMDRNNMVPVYVGTKSAFAGPVRKHVRVKFFKTSTPDLRSFRLVWPQTDIFLYDSASFESWFPQLKNIEDEAGNEILVHEDSLLAGGDEKLKLPAAVLKAGYYDARFECVEDGRVVGEYTRSFTIFDRAANELPGRSHHFTHLPYNAAERGQKLTLITGNTESDIFSIYYITWYERTNRAPVVKSMSVTRTDKKGINEFQFTVPSQATGDMLLTWHYVLNNEVHEVEKRIYIHENDVKPEIVIEKYRSRLVPGGKETFSVSIKTNNVNTAAQLMTTLYDATLDKIEEHEWQLPHLTSNFGVRNNWYDNITDKTGSSITWLSSPVVNKQGLSLWWLNPLEYGYRMPGVPGEETMQGEMFTQGFLVGRVSGISVINAKGLDEVVVVGYGSARKSNLTVSSVVIRGNASLKGFKNIMVVVDGAVFEGDISTIDVNAISQAVILKGADAVNIYGSKAANGVIVISTKGPVVLPQALPPAPVIRKNFNETAFFYPSITADKKGFYNIHFTLPQSVTSWKWKLLAHTKKAVFTYAERTLYSQLPLMVQPDMPRFLYQGDKIILRTRISNLDSTDINGELSCTIEDMVTGEDITARLLAASRQPFSVGRSSNGTASFAISIPANLMNPLRVRIAAQSSSFSDGEEHVIPVLAKKILVAQSVPVVFNGNNVQAIAQPALPADTEPLGIGLFITPQPQAAMVNGLTWLANYPFTCAEQTFNKMLAHAMAVKIVRTDTAIQKMLNANNPVKQVNDIAPGISEQTMPWLQLNHKNDLQQQKLAKLLDTSESNNMAEKYFDELRSLQQADGGLSWFPGGKSDPYISAYILAGLGKMEKEKYPITVDKNYNSFLKFLLGYCDTWFLKNYTESSRWQNLHYLYGRSFWLQQFPLRTDEKAIIDSLLNSYWQEQQSVSFGRQSLLVIVTTRVYPKGDPLYARAMEHLESLRQLAIRDQANGIRWKAAADQDDLSTRHEEWIVKTAEAFEADINDRETIPGIITWLLRNRNEHNWSTTKATADVAGLLQRAQKTMNKPLQIQAKIDATMLEVSNDLLKGKLFQYTGLAAKAFPTIAVTTRDTGNSGSINYYYFTENPDNPGNEVKIVRSISRYNGASSSWEAITASTVLKAGDKIKTTLTITTPRLLQYVFIDEKRAAACEPVDAASGYEYNKNLSYYKSVRDVGFRFFAEKMPAGISEISYESVVAKTGSFAWGPAALECMYRPEIRAYSNSLSLEIKE